MANVLDRPGAPPPVGDSTDGGGEYRCDCAGFRALDLMRMCLRCLEAYSDGLEQSDLEPNVVQREMKRVAVRLARLLKDDPLIANLPLPAVLRAAEGRN